MVSILVSRDNEAYRVVLLYTDVDVAVLPDTGRIEKYPSVGMVLLPPLWLWTVPHRKDVAVACLAGNEARRAASLPPHPTNMAKTYFLTEGDKKDPKGGQARAVSCSCPRSAHTVPSPYS